MSQNNNPLVCVAIITGTHGVRGLLKLKLYSEGPETLTSHGALLNKHGEECCTITSLSPHKDAFLTQIEGINSIEAAKKLVKKELYIRRDTLPEIKDEEEFYYIDLIGLEAQFEDGKPAGKILGVHNFGAGDLLEIASLKGSSYFIPFTKEAVPNVNLPERYVVIIPPEGLLTKNQR